MPNDLEPCALCNRHVRGNERACPFCGADRAPRVRVEELRLLTRLDRSTLVALGAALSAAGIAIGCREAPPVAIYGAPAPVEQTPSAAPPASAEPPAVEAPPASSVREPADAPAVAPTASSTPQPPPTASARPAAPAAAYGGPPNMKLAPDLAPSPAPVPAPKK